MNCSGHATEGDCGAHCRGGTAQAVEILAEELPLHQPQMSLAAGSLETNSPTRRTPCTCGWLCYQRIEHN